MTLASSFKKIVNSGKASAKKSGGRDLDDDTVAVDEAEECATAFEVAGLGLGLDEVNFSSDET